jgi:hypothetical protein
MSSVANRNWPGALSIALALGSLGMYAASIAAGPSPAYLDKAGPLFVDLFQLSTTSSFVVGIAAVIRARRGAGGLGTAIIGLVLGGVLTFLWVAWIGMLMLNPGALGDLSPSANL